MTSLQATARPALLRTSALWVWYYANNIRVDDALEEEPIEVLSDIFGEADSADLERLLGSPTPEPAFGSALEIRLPGGFSWRLQFSNAPAVYHLLDHPGFDTPACLGWDDPHPRLPALPWHRLRPFLADPLARWRSDQVPPCFTLPLLAPMLCWDPDEQAEVHDALHDAWRATGVLTATKVDEVVDRLTRFLGETAPTTGDALIGATGDAPIGAVLAAVARHRESGAAEPFPATASLRDLLHRADTPPHVQSDSRL